MKGEKKTSERKAPKVGSHHDYTHTTYTLQVDLSPLFLPRDSPMTNRHAVSYHCG